MSDSSKIEWTDATWNPVTGCTEVSPGCDHCYAKTFAERWRGTPGHHFEQGFDVVLRPERLDQPLRWKKPRRVFVDSMSDLFHDQVPVEFIARVFAVMALTPQHTYQLLTKRHGRMRSVLRDECRCGSGHAPSIHLRSAMAWAVSKANPDRIPGVPDGAEHHVYFDAGWPLKNVWLGVSVEDQQRADLRIPALLDTPAAVRFLSCEPLLGPVELDKAWLVCDHLAASGAGAPGVWRCDSCGAIHREIEDPDGSVAVTQVDPPRGYQARYEQLERGQLIDWVIVGGESGPGARPMDPAWARSLRDQCTSAGVAFHFKQWGGRNKKATGRELDGRTWDEYPAVTS